MPSLCSMLTQCTSLRAPSEPSLFDHELGHHEQADALHALGRAGHARQHQVDDVLGHVVLAVGDEDLGAEDLVGAVGLRLGAACAPAPGRCRPAARSGSSCRSTRRSPASRGRSPCSSSEPAVSSASMAPSVSSGHSAKLRLAELSISPQAAPMVLGRPWPPKSAGCCRPCQPPSAYCRKASLKPGVVVTSPSFQRRRIAVALDVQRRDHVLVELRAFLEHGLRGVEAGVLEARQLRDLVDAGEVLDVEQHVLEGGGVAHGLVSSAADDETGHRERCPGALSAVQALRAP